MIWFEQPIVSGDPDVILQGIYNEPSTERPLIEISLIWGEYIVPLYSHNPAALRQYEPTEEEVLAKYNNKIFKLKETVKKHSYDQVIEKWFPEALS